MIRFFRSIRQGLLNEGKTSKYLRYAVGEILLVVIGILIALQVNNWNIARAEAKLEQEYIQRLIEDLERDRESFIRLLALAELKIGLVQLLKDAVDDTDVALARPAEFLVAIKQAHGIRRDKANSDTFEELRSTGYLRLLRDNELKSQLFVYYRYDRDRRSNEPMHFQTGFKYIELSADVLTWKHTDLEFPTVGPNRMEPILNMQVDEKLVTDTLSRLRANSELVTWLNEIHQLQIREEGIYSIYVKLAEALLEALKAAQDGSN